MSAERATPEADERLCRGYFAALSARDWRALGELCHDGVVYTLRGASPLSQEVRGRDAFLAMTAEVFSQFPQARFFDLEIKPMSAALGMYLVEYQAEWQSPAGGAQRDAGRVVLEIARDKIMRIAVILSDAQLEDACRERAAP